MVSLGITLTLISGIFISISDNLWVLGISRFVEGLGCGAFFPAAYSMIADWKDSHQSLGEFNFLLNAGLAAGVFFSGMLAELEIKTAINIFTLLAFLSFIFLLRETRGGQTPDNSGRKRTNMGLQKELNPRESRMKTGQASNPACIWKKPGRLF